MYQQRIDFLKESHRVLNDQIDSMTRSGAFDQDELMTLKKKRLNLKDQISLLENKQEFFEENGDSDD